MREDGKKQVCIVGLQEFEVSDVQVVKEYIERGNAARSTGSTGANEGVIKVTCYSATCYSDVLYFLFC